MKLKEDINKKGGLLYRQSRVQGKHDLPIKIGKVQEDINFRMTSDFFSQIEYVNINKQIKEETIFELNTDEFHSLLFYLGIPKSYIEKCKQYISYLIGIEHFSEISEEIKITNLQEMKTYVRKVRDCLRDEIDNLKTFHQLIHFLDEHFRGLKSLNENWNKTLISLGKNIKIKKAFVEFLNCDKLHKLIERNFDNFDKFDNFENFDNKKETISSIIWNGFHKVESIHIYPRDFLRLIQNLSFEQNKFI